MKDKSRTSLLIAFISLLAAIIATGFAFAADYDKVVAGSKVKQTVVKIVNVIVPVGGDITVAGYEHLFISAIAADEINIAYSRPDIERAYSSTNTTAHFGRCKINSEIVVRSNISLPALRIKVVGIDMEHGTATLIITKFWPYPNEVQIKDIDPPTKPETELDKK